jgi:4-amino-4-deoxy-L-arabinose transferase-like glycosyltransferase
VQTKLPHYLLPTFPALAFLMADAIVRCLRGEHGDLANKRTRAAIVVWGLVVIALGVAPWRTPGTFDRPMMTVILSFTILAGIYVAVVLVAFLARRPRIGLIAMGLGMFPAMAIIWGLYLPHAQFIRLSGNVADILKQNGAGPRDTLPLDTSPGDIQMLGYKEPALAFHQGGTIREQSDNDFLIRTPRAGWPRFMTIRDDIWQRTPAEVKSQLEILGSAHGLAYAAGGKTWTVWVVRKK